MNISEKGKWKYVPIEKRYFDDSTFEGFGSMQVLTNYEITGKGIVEKPTNPPAKKQKKEKQKDRKEKKKSGETESVKQNEDNSNNQNGNRKIKKAKKSQKIQNKTENERDENVLPKKQQNKKAKNVAEKNKREVTVAKIIDITDVGKHLEKAEEAKTSQSNATKRKTEDDDGPKKKKLRKNKKKKNKKERSNTEANTTQDTNQNADAKSAANKKADAKSNTNKKADSKSNTNKKADSKSKANKKSGAKPNTIKDKEEPGEEKKKAPKKVNMSKWKDLFVPEPVLQALSDVGFDSPTPIQCLTLPAAIRDRLDILGAAETGSGKTLAFGIPMIHNILQYKQFLLEGGTDSDSESESDWDSEGEEKLEEDLEEGEDGEEEEEEGEGEEEQDEEEGEEEEEGEDVEEEEGDEDEEDIVEDEEGSEEEMEMEEVGVKGDEEDEEGENEDEEEDDSGNEDGEYDLPPGEEEQYFDLGEDEMGCVAAVNNVEFDFLGEEGAGMMPLIGPGGPGPDKAGRDAGRDMKPLMGLVLTPTRELAIQVKDHLETACAHTDIKVCCIVGGMAAQKQERLLRKGPEIVVATPGRFWELLEGGDPHLAKVVKLRNLVIDEADRMVEKGHFEELRNFLDFLKENETNKRRRQNFVFSATLTLVHKAPTRLLLKKKKVKQLTSEDKLQSLVEMIGLDPKAKVVDLTRKVGTAETLVESKINCSKEDKDLYLYYFLKRYPGRTLVFSNSKDCLRRLSSIFTILECKPLPLHADMHQRQRLKNLDRFKASPTGLLLATDVAARGLDIPNVQHVIHYQVPRTSENYVHRSGRTARASKEGLSVMLIGPDDMTNYRKITRTLSRAEELGVFPVETELIPAMRQCLGLARRIDKDEHRTTKHKKQNMWFQKAAKEMDIELDEDELLNDLGDSHEQAMQKQQIAGMRRELKMLLARPNIPLTFSGRYPTKTGKLDLPFGSGSKPGGACAAVKKHSGGGTQDNSGGSGKSKKKGKSKYRRKR